MRYEAEVGRRTHQVDVHRTGDLFTVLIDGKSRRVDAARVDTRTLSLIIMTAGPKDPPCTRKPGLSRPGDSHEVGRPGLIRPGASYEVTVAPDPASGDLTVYVGAIPVPVGLNSRRRWGRRDDASASGTGPDRITAPMPGKIVRVLVQTGEAVRARQPVIVVEAMKMENELRAGRDGTVAEIHAREGMSVDAGTLLVLIQ